MAYGHDYLGNTAKALSDFVAGKGPFVQKFKNAKNPLIIFGSSLAEHPDGKAMYNELAKFVGVNKAKLLTSECPPSGRGTRPYSRGFSDLLFPSWPLVLQGMKSASSHRNAHLKRSPSSYIC